tara:strand:- start:80 stop:565 length:486 start_codon:yes stop_codon:yes gene_type:complete
MGRKKHREKANFAGIPRLVMDCPDYTSLGGNAIRLLIEMAYQYKGYNNGDLCPAWTLMKKRGFSSKETLSNALAELVAAEMLVLTRQGTFRKNSPSLYAVTWLPIDDFPNKNMELASTTLPVRKFSIERQQGWPRILTPPVRKPYRKGTKAVPKAVLKVVN